MWIKSLKLHFAVTFRFFDHAFCNKHRLELGVWIILSSISFICAVDSKAYAQYVNDAAFCRDVKNYECKHVIPHGAKVSLNSLRRVDGKRALYFWGNIQSRTRSAVSVIFFREGSCYKKEDVRPDDAALRELSSSEQIGGLLSSISFRQVWYYLGLEKVEGASGNIKGNIVFIPESGDFRIFDFRHVLCKGNFRARLVGSDGNPLAGNNDIRVVIVD